MTRVARLLILLPLLLAGCGGGLYIGWGDYGDNRAPSVSIATGQLSVAAGGTLRVVAAASDNDSGIDEVAFYRFDGSAATRLGSVGSPPYQWDVAVPAVGDTPKLQQAYARYLENAARQSVVN